MANGYNPYAAAQGQTDLLENLLQAADIERKADQSIGKQKKEMTDKFEQDLTDAQIKQERELQKKKKKNPFETLFKAGSMFLPGIGPVLANALLSMKQLKDQSGFAKDRINVARKLGMDTGAYKGTFLGSQATKQKKQSDALLDSLYEDAKVSGSDMLAAGAKGAFEGYQMGKIGQSLTTPVAGTPIDITDGSKLTDAVDFSGKFDVSDITKAIGEGSSTVTPNLGPIESIFANLKSKDLSTLFDPTLSGADAGISNISAILPFLLQGYAQGGKVDKRGY